MVPAGQVAPTVHEQLVPLQQFGPQPYGPLWSPFCRTTNGEQPLVVHAPHEQLLLHVSVLCGQFVIVPQPWVDPGAHAPWPLHAPKPGQVQLLEHVSDCVPQLPHPCDVVWPGAHAPCPVQLPYAPHAQLELHVRVSVPQLPQPCDCVVPAAQAP